MSVTSLPTGYTEVGTLKRGTGNLEGEGVVPICEKVYTPNDSNNYILIKNISTYDDNKEVKSYDVYEIYADETVYTKELMFFGSLYVVTDETQFDTKDFSLAGTVGTYKEDKKSTVNINTNLEEYQDAKIYINGDKTVLYSTNSYGKTFYFKKLTD